MVRFKTIAGNVKKDLIPVIKKTLYSDSEVLFVYLFGSHATGTTGPLSDIDVAVFLHPKIKDFFEKKGNIYEKLVEKIFTEEIDVVILNQAPPYLVMEIIRGGNLLFSRDENLRVKFETKNIIEYLDTERLREMEEDFLVTKIREGRYGHPGIG